MQTITKRLIRWAIGIALLLVIPLVLTLLGSGVDGDGWHWTPFDFIFMGTLLFGSALTYELVSRKMKNSTYRIAVGLAVTASLVLLWVNAAVGIIGDGPINSLYVGLVALGFLGAIISRFQPQKLSYVLFGMAILQMLIPIIAFIVNKPDFSPGVLQVFMLNGFFAVLFIGSGLLFRQTSKRIS